MTREQARQDINSRLPLELPKAKKRVTGHDTFLCPFCGNGSGTDGTGICTKDGKRYTCFRGCFSSLDYLDILKMQYNTDSEGDIFDRYNITIDDTAAPTPRPSAATVATPPETTEPEQVDYTQYFKDCNARANQTDYFSLRGISSETVDKFLIGFDPAWRHPKTPKIIPITARVIFPTSKYTYTARDTNPDAPSKYKSQNVGEDSPLFNYKALSDTKHPYIYVVEGVFDALSVIDVGGQAVALGGVSGKNKLLKAIKATPPTATIVLAIDNDEPGQKAQADIKRELGALGFSFLEANISGDCKDPNEHLQSDRQTFTELVKEPLKASQIAHERRKNEYLQKNAVVHCLDAFMGEIASNADTPAIPTGFNELDNVLDGGFFEGLHILGALSSIGKTSFCLQIADQIARMGQDVIIFSLEMSRYELISKSLSRLTFEADKSKRTGSDGKEHYYARTNRQITASSKWKYYSERELELIKNAVNTYGENYAPNLFIHEGIGNIGAEAIKSIVKEHISFTGHKPMVLIDYLQILQPYDIRASDKTNTDKSVLELKRMSRDFKIPVFAISSFNRDNYLSPVNMASFKESGAIEYSSDLLLGVQFQGMSSLKLTDGKKTENINEIEKWKKANPRKIELRVLKNRNGATGGAVDFDYVPQFNFFMESTVQNTQTRGY